ncbi:MAG: hypothetical protein M3Z51_01560 [Snodgrassella alvi]|nr:hypothetical protein [Snodgrassella alvi]
MSFVSSRFSYWMRIQMPIGLDYSQSLLWCLSVLAGAGVNRPFCFSWN